MFKFSHLVSELKKHKEIFIQTHNFPDHDAIASAYGLSNLLQSVGIRSKIIFKGEIQRNSLLKMIEMLNIPIYNIENLQLKSTDKIIIVDGCKGNRNVDDMSGDEICVIDHHNVDHPEDVTFVDIRNSYGSCSTIIYSYFKELSIPIPKDVATAFLVGINIDTANLTRGVSKEDIEAFHSLYLNANTTLVNSILRNNIKIQDLSFYKTLLNNLQINSKVAFCYFKDGCNQNLMGILSDFVLSLEEIEFVILCAKNQETINFSIRSEKSNLNASDIIQKALYGIGFGGGHFEMAGGVIKDLNKFDEAEILNKFLTTIKTETLKFNNQFM